MTHPDGGTPVLAPGEAHQRCLRELRQQHPDYSAAQVFATLSLDETLRDIAAKLSDLTRQLVVTSRYR